MKRRGYVFLFVVELVILVVFQGQLGDALPTQLSMFTGNVIMSSSYATGILVPAILFLLAIHLLAFGLAIFARNLETRSTVLVQLGARLTLAVSVYLEVFTLVLMTYFFSLAIAPYLLILISSALLVAVIIEVTHEYKMFHTGNNI